MTLLDIIAEFDENKSFTVKSIAGVVLSVYDGKNAIDAKYNGCAVVAFGTDASGNGYAIIAA